MLQNSRLPKFEWPLASSLSARRERTTLIAIKCHQQSRLRDKGHSQRPALKICASQQKDRYGRCANRQVRRVESFLKTNGVVVLVRRTPAAGRIQLKSPALSSCLFQLLSVQTDFGMGENQSGLLPHFVMACSVKCQNYPLCDDNIWQ